MIDSLSGEQRHAARFRGRLGRLAAPWRRNAQEQRQQREQERGEAIGLVRDQLDREVGHVFEPEVALAIHGVVAKAPSRLMAVQLEDLLGLEEQPNLPGTVGEHPNWRRRLPVALEELETHGLFGDLLAAIAAERPRKE